MKTKVSKIPKPTYSENGYTDEGISLVLRKPSNFKYSEKFLKYWYGVE